MTGKNSVRKNKSKRKTKTKGNKNGYDEALSQGQATALYYGFTPIKPVLVTPDSLRQAKSLGEAGKGRHDCGPQICPEEKISILKHYLESNWQNLPHPVMVSFAGSMTPVKGKGKRTTETELELEILGTGKSIAEAELIKTSFEILREAGYSNLVVLINSIGDKDSLNRFTRELSAYYRKNLNLVCNACRQALKKDAFELVSCQNEKCKPISLAAPKSLSFLTEPSRAHLTEILEYLEMLEIPYRMDNTLVGSKTFCNQAIFEIKDDSAGPDSPPLGLGLRYNCLAKRVGWKKDFPGVGVRLVYKEPKSGKTKIKVKYPKIYFIQLGFEAKLHSLKVIEILREAKISVFQSLSRDRLTVQIASAENLKIPYILIMGQKEALEDSVIIRTNANRSQETVSIKDLPKYLKNLK